MTTDLLNCEWFVSEDDMIGGWCITIVDAPPSTGAIAIGSFLSKELAVHIVKGHNEWFKLEKLKLDIQDIYDKFVKSIKNEMDKIAKELSKDI